MFYENLQWLRYERTALDRLVAWNAPARRLLPPEWFGEWRLPPGTE